MTEFLYQTLAKIGYTHPLHPVLTHVVMGMVIGGFIFGLVAWLFRRPNLSQTGRHCIGLALIALFPTALSGYMDWQHRFSGAWVFPIKMKIILAAVLLVFLIAAVVFGFRSRTSSKSLLVGYLLCLVTALGIGYFGGELVYGVKTKPAEVSEGAVQKGAELFNNLCAGCHYTDKADAKLGPGLLGLFGEKKLPSSGRLATEENVRLQMKNPFDKMPAYRHLTEEEVADLIAYMKTL
jgi:uncharacterized membrane protein